MSRTAFVTGRLAESALRRVLASVERDWPERYEVVVLPIAVAALMTPDWVAKRLAVPDGTSRVILPGYCGGDLDSLSGRVGCTVERGPKDLHDLARFLCIPHDARSDYGQYDIEILAEINHAPRLPMSEIEAHAARYRDAGADVIDLGMVPGEPWSEVGTAVAALRDAGHRVSIDTFSPQEADFAAAGGAELWLSVHEETLPAARAADCEVVIIPQRPRDPDWLDQIRRCVDRLEVWGVSFRLDPVIEPIGLGFASAVERYAITRREFPDAEIMMGVGNVTELLDVDSAGVNVLLAGICQELGIRSVLTTEVIGWCQTAVRELHFARQLVAYAARRGVPPKNVDANLILLRDARAVERATGMLDELARRIRDRNFRIFVERGEIHVINSDMHRSGTDPYMLFDEMQVEDASHAFYLGYEMAKAVTALTLGKHYRQDEALDWGFLTVSETSHVERRGGRSRSKRHECSE